MENNLEVINVMDSLYSNDEETEGFELSSGSTWYYPINFPIREYQYKIVETSLYNNTLVCLPTGLGKTFIAAVVMYNFSRWYPKGKVVFMAPTRPLVAQQINACHNIMGIPSEQTAELTGSVHQKLRLEAWVKKRVLFTTPQIFHNDLENKLVPFRDIKCVVIDEAHKALGRQSYCEAIRILSEQNKYFRVLALSATPGNSLDKVREVVQNLNISTLELRDEMSEDIKPYINERKIEIILVCLSKELQDFKNRYIEIMDPHVKILISRGILHGLTANISKGKIFFLQKSYQESQQKNASNAIIQKTFVILMTMTHAYELMQKHGLRAFYNFYQNHLDKYWISSETQLHTLLQDIKNYLGDFPIVQAMPNGSLPEIPPNIIFGHSKFEKLKSILLNHFENASSENRDTRSIVFVEFKDSVKEVFVLLLQCRPSIRPQMFVGQSDQKQKVQLQALEDFRTNKVNVLISTCVGEEGLDVGEVDLIVCFDGCQKNASRLVQRMGRTGRKRNGQIYILVTDGKEYKDLKATLKKRDTFNNKVLESSNIVHCMYQDNPRMIPNNFNPTCHKITFESQPKTAQEGKKRKNVSAERKKRVTKPKEKSVPKPKDKQARKPNASEFSDNELSQGNQFSMHKFLVKTNKEGKVANNIKSYDGKPIKNNEVRLLSNDSMGWEFITLWTLINSNLKSNQRQMDIQRYVPQTSENDDILQSYQPPSIDTLKSMSSWTRDEVSSLWNVDQSDDEDSIHSNFDNDIYDNPVFNQSPNMKYNSQHDETINDPRFLPDEAFDNIADYFSNNDEQLTSCTTVKEKNTSLDDEFNAELGNMTIFDNLLISSDEENMEICKEESKPIPPTDIKEEANESSGLFDDLLNFSSDEEEKSNENPNIIFESHIEFKDEKPNFDDINSDSTNSMAVSQAMMEIRNMSLGELDFSNKIMQNTQTKQPAEATIHLPSEVGTKKVSIGRNRTLSNQIASILDSDEDMFIDDDSSDSEMSQAINISLVPDTPKKQQPIASIPIIQKPEKTVASFQPSQNFTHKPLSLSLGITQSKPKNLPKKMNKPSLSLKDQLKEFVDDDLDNAFSKIPIHNDKSRTPVKKNLKLSLNNHRIKNHHSIQADQSEIQNNNLNDHDFNKWSNDTEPIPSAISKYFESSHTENNMKINNVPKKNLKLPRISLFSNAPKTISKTQSTIINPTNKLSLNRIQVPKECSINAQNDKENSRKSSQSSDDENTYIVPKIPKLERKFSPAKQNQNINYNDSFYGTPSRQKWLERKRNKRRYKKQMSPKKARAFIDDEAEVTVDVDTTDGSSDADGDEDLGNFVSNTQYLDESHMNEIYLKSTRSPRNQKFVIREREYLPKELIYSQPFTQGNDDYVNDTFCDLGDDDEEIRYDSSPDELEILEEQLKKRKKRKREEANDELKVKTKKVKNKSDSSSEDEVERMRRQTAEESMLLKKK